MNNKSDWIKNAYRKMREIMHQKESEQADRDRLVDQLNWLNFQIQYYTQTNEMDKLIDDFNWVVKNFNQLLKLPSTERISLIGEGTSQE